MTWIGWAFLTAALYGIFDVLVRVSSDKIHPITAPLIFNIASAITVLAFFVYAYMNGEGDKLLEFKPGGLGLAVVIGIIVGLFSMTFIRVFVAGANIPIGVTIVRTGTILVATLIGVLVLKEGVTPKALLGIALSLAGMYLVLTA